MCLVPPATETFLGKSPNFKFKWTWLGKSSINFLDFPATFDLNHPWGIGADFADFMDFLEKNPRGV